MKRLLATLLLVFSVSLLTACKSAPASEPPVMDDAVEEEMVEPVSTMPADPNVSEESAEKEAIVEESTPPAEEPGTPSQEPTAPVEELTPPAEEAAEPTPVVRTIQMTAKQWDFAPSTVTVNEGDTVRLVITSIDVDHGISIPQFGVNSKLKPGETVTVEFVADKTGSFNYFCNVLCGQGHGTMRGTLIVQ